MSLETIISRCLEVEINCIAVTDHNTIAGALKMRQISPFKVIVGEEIGTISGEIIGLFLTEEIPRGLAADETVARIKAQGGLVCIPHPFDRLFRGKLERDVLEALLPDIDIMEVFNARTIFSGDSTKSRLFAQAHGLLQSAGSDSHTPGEIGGAWVEMSEFNDPGEFRLALAQGKIIGRRASPLVHLATSLAKLKKLWKRTE